MKKAKYLFLFMILFSFPKVYAETIANHSTMKHTKKEIIDKYHETRSSFNYNKSVYEEVPSLNIPYKEGKLKAEVEKDTLNQLNFYRYLAGLNELTIDTTRQKANQKGALILAANHSLSHYPTKPSNMDESFYQEGYSACGSKSNTWQGNISNGYRIDRVPEAFIIDNTNVDGNVAHRSSMLNPKAKQVSFGFVNQYATMSIHYDNTNYNKDSYYPWPSSGYFPVEAMGQDSKTLWSIYLGNYQMTKDTKVILEYNNNSYIVNNSSLHYTNYSKNMYYSLPKELRLQITNSNQFISGAKVHVRIESLKNNHNIEYDVKFFSVKESMPEQVILDKKNVTIEIEEEEELKATVLPEEAFDKSVSWESSDSSIVTVSNGRIKGIKEGTATITVKTSNGKTDTCKVTVNKQTPGVLYSTHIQDIGWQKYYRDGELSGTTHQSKRLEAIKIKLKGISYSGSIEYKTHIEDYGWEKYFNRNNELSGTSGQAKRLEAIKIRLIGEVANHYDVYYRVHAQEFGWLGWARNGEEAGTAGYSYRLEGIEIKLVEKGKSLDDYQKQDSFKSQSNHAYIEPTKILYQSHIESIGWQQEVHEEQISGTTGKSLKLEAIKIMIEDGEYSGNVEYKTHIQDVGWEKTFKKNNDISGSLDGKRLEALEIRLTGEIKNYFDIYYRVHAQDVGWMNWAKNGEMSGTAGYGRRLEGIEIILVGKGSLPPVRANTKSNKAFLQKQVSYTTHVQDIGWQSEVADGAMAGTSGQSKRLEGIKIYFHNSEVGGDIEYRTHVEDYGWMDYVKNGEMSGTSGQSKRLEAIQIRLTGKLEEKYDIYYRVHAQDVGWMNWAKNGEKSGTAGYGRRLEGIEIVIVDKGDTPPNRNNIHTDKAFIDKNV